MSGPRYRIQFTPAADRDFRALPRELQRRIRPRIDALVDQPRPHGAVAIQGGESILRLRVGEYRILYQVMDREVLVLVIRVGHRREVYRRH